MTLYHWFARTVERSPDATALEVAGDTYTYAELHDLVERLAVLIRAAGSGPPGPPGAVGAPGAVGLLAARSLAAYAGYLATLRTGATVVPLNPAFPPARNAQMCRGAGVSVILVDDTGAARADDVLADIGATAVHLPAGWATAGTLPATGDDERPEPRPDDVAYTLFTSGSTGRPKGVPIRHRNVDAYLTHCLDRYRAGPGDRFSQTFDLTFDPSVFDMFLAWGSGATLVVPQPDEILTPVRWVGERRITHWFSVPSVVSLARRLRMLTPGCLPSLRYSLFAGEQLTWQQARAWAAAAPGSVLENLYGPTELTVTCTGYRLPADPSTWPATSNGTVPIGAVYPHLEGVVLDPDGGPAGDGELCLRGPQRFDGYLDPAHDDDRFVTLTDRELYGGEPYYRTGDRVREEAAGLVHCGRLDDQVKLHGYRIELGEVETALRAHPRVQDAVVLAVGSGDGTTLEAVYTGDPAAAGELPGLCAARLPAYMVPARVRHLAALPTNANGKTDRRRLAELVGTPGPVRS